MSEKLIKFIDNLNSNLCKSIDLCKIGISSLSSKERPNIEETVLGDKLRQTKEYLTNYIALISQIEHIYSDNDSKHYSDHDSSNSFLTILETDEDMGSIHKIYKNGLRKTELAFKNMQKTKTFETKIVKNIEDVSLQGNELNLPVVKKITDIPPMFYWYEGDNIYKKGVYVSICEGFYVKAAFPNVLTPGDTNNRLYSLKCKYENKQICEINKKKISQIHGSDIRECFYVHKKEKFNKISNQFRCYIEGLGNYNNLNKDLNLSDDLLMMIWYQNKFNNGNLILTNLDVF